MTYAVTEENYQDIMLPWDLLLDADPNQPLVAEYLKRSRLLLAKTSGTQSGGILGVLVFEERATEWEILNVAVAEKFQNQGIGGALIDTCLEKIGVSQHKKPVLIKTGDLTSPALSLYQKKGFKQIALVKNYFIEHYPEPIYEEGQQLFHQVILQRLP